MCACLLKSLHNIFVVVKLCVVELDRILDKIFQAIHCVAMKKLEKFCISYTKHLLPVQINICEVNGHCNSRITLDLNLDCM